MKFILITVTLVASLASASEVLHTPFSLTAFSRACGGILNPIPDSVKGSLERDLALTAFKQCEPYGVKRVGEIHYSHTYAPANACEIFENKFRAFANFVCVP